MIDDTILDEILPVPDIDELKDETVAELKDEDFVITNFNSGGIFYTLLMIVFQVRIELVKLLRKVLNNMFVRTAQGIWMELKAADYSKKRKAAVKTQGNVTLTRAAVGAAITIAKGHVFKTEKDINGDELRFFALADTTMLATALSFTVPVEAEKEGAAYNVAVGQITKSLTHIEGIDTITNASGWITQEGSDLETIESLRARTLNAWGDLATTTTAQKIKNACEAISGVLFVRVNDQHPRGQGTVDIIVTSTAGEATEALLAKVTTAAVALKSPDDDFLVKSAVTQATDVDVTVTVETGENTDGLADKVKVIVISTMKISSDRELNKLLHADHIYAIKSSISTLKNVKVTAPASDLILDADIVIIPGIVTVTIQEE